MEKTNTQIILGRSENQASKLMTDILLGKDVCMQDLKEVVASVQFKEDYKFITRKLFEYNCALDEELIEDKKDTFENKVKTPSPKQKYYPKCKEIIPLSWKQHLVCGWKE
jgi:hypothetical protein